MDQLLSTVGELFTLANLVFCVFVWIVVWIQRKILELSFKNIKENKYWRALFLPLGPIGTGAILSAIFSTYPFPEMFSSHSSRIIFGSVLGMFSAHTYKIIKELFDNQLKRMLKEKVESVSGSSDEDLI